MSDNHTKYAETSTARCYYCFEPMPGPHRGHATPAGDDNPYKHDAAEAKELRESDGEGAL